MALPSLLLVTLALLWVVGLVNAQLQCVDAARAGARVVSRGETFEASRSAALAAAPDGATVVISRSGDFITVEVAVEIQPAAGLLDLLPGLTVRGVAHAIAEDAIGSASLGATTLGEAPVALAGAEQSP